MRGTNLKIEYASGPRNKTQNRIFGYLNPIGENNRSSNAGGESKDRQECYQCGSTRHFKRDCPELRRGGGGSRSRSKDKFKNKKKKSNINNLSQVIDADPPAPEVAPPPRTREEPRKSTLIDQDHLPSPTHDGSKKKITNALKYFFLFGSNFQYLNAVLAHYLHPKTIR